MVVWLLFIYCLRCYIFVLVFKGLVKYIFNQFVVLFTAVALGGAL